MLLSSPCGLDTASGSMHHVARSCHPLPAPHFDGVVPDHSQDASTDERSWKVYRTAACGALTVSMCARLSARIGAVAGCRPAAVQAAMIRNRSAWPRRFPCNQDDNSPCYSLVHRMHRPAEPRYRSPELAMCRHEQRHVHRLCRACRPADAQELHRNDCNNDLRAIGAHHSCSHANGCSRIDQAPTMGRVLRRIAAE